MRDTIELAREAGFETLITKGKIHGFDRDGDYTEELKAFEALVRADERDRAMRENAYVQAEREACADKTGEFARKWWSIHCDSNKHMETTRKAHDDFCALQAAIRARGTHDPA
jgi:hypothetical protein